MVALLAACTLGALLRFTRRGRSIGLRPIDAVKIIAVSIGLGCVALSLITLAVG